MSSPTLKYKVSDDMLTFIHGVSVFVLYASLLGMAYILLYEGKHFGIAQWCGLALFISAITTFATDGMRDTREAIRLALEQEQREDQ